jgi:CRISPR-associated protein Csh2
MKGLPNSEILLIYEARLCNPNGDPDEENRPRIDHKTNVNLVSDVRLKRFFRDYVVSKFGEEYIYVTKLGGKSVRADTRVARLFGIEKLTKDIEERSIDVPRRCIDARLFGATIPIGGEEAARGAQKTFIGPAQFAWGFSLHPVELVESSTITSVFMGREAAEQYGTMGKDWRLYYSLIGFYGVVSGRRAEITGLDERDLKLLDDVLWEALLVEPTTRSKIGERPHLYMRVEYKDADMLVGDLRRYVKTTFKETVRDFKDVELDLSALFNVLEEHRGRISKIYARCSDEMGYVRSLLEERFREVIFRLPHDLSDDEVLGILRKSERP